MSTLDRLAGLLGFVRMSPSGGPAESPAGVVPETGEMRVAPYPPNTLTPQSLTFAAARAILEEHESGRFGLSAALARTVLRDPDLAAALNRRLLALDVAEVLGARNQADGRDVRPARAQEVQRQRHADQRRHGRRVMRARERRPHHQPRLQPVPAQ